MKEKIVIMSLNCASYILMTTDEELLLREDDFRQGNYYCLFNNTPEVRKACEEFRNNVCLVEIHQFLDKYRLIRKEITETRNKRKGVVEYE